MNLNRKVEFGEVQFYFLVVNPDDDDKLIPYALVSIYSPPDEDILEQSYHTLWACEYTGSDGYRVVSISSIMSSLRTILSALSQFGSHVLTVWDTTSQITVLLHIKVGPRNLALFIKSFPLYLASCTP